MNQPPKSKTPLTDAEAMLFRHESKTEVVPSCFARSLELRLNEAVAQLSEVNNLIESHKLDLEAQKNAYERKLAGVEKERDAWRQTATEASDYLKSIGKQVEEIKAITDAMKGNQ